MSNIELHNIDCMDFMRDLPDNAFDLALTDPPYNVKIDYGQDYDDSRADYWDWCWLWFNELNRVSKMVAFTPGSKNQARWIQKFVPVDIMCWYKINQCSRSALGGFQVWESILVYGEKIKKVSQNGFAMPIAMQNDAAFHPCPKLLKAWSKLMDLLAPQGSVIFDPFTGSGTTAIAAHRLGNDFVGCEINRDYFKAAKARIERETSQENLFEPQEVYV